MEVLNISKWLVPLRAFIVGFGDSTIVPLWSFKHVTFIIKLIK